MKKILFASATALLMSGSFASADNPLIPNDNDHMAALGFAIERNAAADSRWYGARIVTSASQGGGVVTATTAAQPVSPGFLLHTSSNDQKQVENQYAR